MMRWTLEVREDLQIELLEVAQESQNKASYLSLLDTYPKMAARQGQGEVVLVGSRE
jgi:hypothetical protein